MTSSEHGSTVSGGVEQKSFAWEDGDFIEAGEPSLPDDIQVDMDENELAEAIAAAQEILSIASSSTYPSREPSAIHLKRKFSDLKFTPMDMEKGTSVIQIPKENSSALLTSPLPPSSTGDANTTPNNGPCSCCSKILSICIQFFLPFIPVKWRGLAGKKPPRRTKFRDILISSVLAFTGIVLITIIDYFYLTETFTTQNDHAVPVRMLSGAYAATAVLVYEAYQSPLAQPRNVIGSFTVASIIGVSVRIFCQTVGIPEYVAGGLALAVGLAGMNITKTVHPPGGACALIAVIGGKNVHALGYGYVLTSMGGAFIMVAVAVLGNNLAPHRQYPVYWY